MMSVYTWKSWAGDRRSVEANEVTFESGHVAFWKVTEVGLGNLKKRVLVLAVANASIIDLEIKGH